MRVLCELGGVVRDISPRTPHAPIEAGIEFMHHLKDEFIVYVDVLEESFVINWLRREQLWGGNSTYRSDDLLAVARSMRRNSVPPNLIVTAEPLTAQACINAGFPTVLFTDPQWNPLPVHSVLAWEQVTEAIEAQRLVKGSPTVRA